MVLRYKKLINFAYGASMAIMKLFLTLSVITAMIATDFVVFAYGTTPEIAELVEPAVMGIIYIGLGLTVISAGLMTISETLDDYTSILD